MTCSGVSPPRRVAHPVGQRQESRTQRRVAGDEAGPQQRLRLPHLRPAGRSTARTRRGCAPADPAGPRGAGRRRRRAAGRATGRTSSRRSSSAIWCAEPLAASSATPRRRFVDEQHVGVGGVAHLVPAEPAHADDGEPHLVGPCPRRRRPQRGAEGGVGDVGERLPTATTSSGDSAGARSPAAEQVGAGDPEQLPAAQRADRRTAAPAPPRLRGPMKPCRSAAAVKPSTRDCRRAGLQLGVVGEQPQRLRVAGEQVGGVPGQAEHPGQPQRDRALVAQQPQVPRGGAERVGDLPVVEQAAVRLGRVGELLQQHRQQGALDRGGAGHPAGQRLEVPQRAGRVGEAEDLQPLPGRLGRHAQRLGGHPGHRLEQRPVEQLGVQPADLGRRGSTQSARNDSTASRPGVGAVAERLASQRSARAVRAPSGTVCVRRRRCSCSRCSTLRRKR